MNQNNVSGTSGASGWVLGLVLGAVIGAMEQSLAGLVVGALLGYLLAQVAHLQRQLSGLQKRATTEPVPRSAPVEWPAAQAAAPSSVVAPAPVEPAAVVAAPVVPPPEPVEEPAASSAWSPPASPPQPRAPSMLNKAIERAWTWLRGGNPLARAGIVILFFGAAFLARYAAERTYVPVELRFVFIGAGAMVLLLLGWRLRAKRRLYAHILQGGGVAGLYLTVFAATRLYQLVPPGFALSLMVVVAVTSAVLAVAQSSLPLAVIGTAGGFLAPILVSTGAGNHVALFSYYTVLNLGVFTVAWFRAWRVLNLIGFVFTFGIAGLFRATAYGPEKMVSTDAFLVLFFLMYVAISILFSLRQKPDLRGYVSGSLVFGLPVAAFTMHATMVSHIPYALAWSALALGAFYLALAWMLLRSGRDTLRLLAEAFAALGVIFASLAIPLGFDTQTTAAMWAVEGAGLLWLGVRQQRALARAFGVLLQMASGVAYLHGAASLHTGTPILNSAYIGTVMIAVSGALSAWWLHRAAERVSRHEQGFEFAFVLWAALWWVGGGVVEIHRAWPAQSLGAILTFLAASGVALETLGARVAWPAMRRIAVALLVPAVLIGLLQALQLGHPSVRAGALGWPLLLIAYYRLLWRCERAADEGMNAVLPALHAAACWLLALLVAWESSWQIRQSLTGVWSLLPWGLVPAAILWALTVHTPRPEWPLARHAATYRRLAALPLVAVAAAWVLAINLSSDGAADALPYVPLLNPLDISVALILAVLLRYGVMMASGEAPMVTTAQRRPLIAAFAALSFLWLNAALLRALHHELGTPLHAHGVAHSTVAQAALSIFWGLLGFGAMILSSRRGWRLLWIAGAAMMAIVVVKLFLVDTAGSGTLARIVSFLTVGVLLLVTGYVSPLPPPRREETSP
ncbi:MAG: DUF2339 domain-containing protein [Sinimarinibacterium sp.]|jgi:uncharacterized membrane protein